MAFVSTFCMQCDEFFVSRSARKYCDKCKALGAGKKVPKVKKKQPPVLGFTAILNNKNPKYKGKWKY